MRKAADRSARFRRPRWWIVGMLVVLAAVGVMHAGAERSATTPAKPSADFALDPSAVPDDVVLREQLAAAVDLRHRENFDRMLDAKEAGELIEHATLTEVDFDHRTLGIDTLFIVGDELFG